MPQPAARRKWLTIVISGLVIAAMIALSAGLPGLELFSRPPATGGDAEGIGSQILRCERPGVFCEYPFLERLFPTLAGLILLGLILYGIVSTDFRQSFLSRLSAGVVAALMIPLIMIFLWLFFQALIFIITLLFGLGPEREDEPGAPASTTEALPAPPSPEAWWGMVVLVVVLTIVFSVMLWRYLRNRQPPEENITQSAEQALSDLRAGADLKDTVMRCYADMSRVLEQEHGLRREEAMTPREFGSYLERRGWQVAHVRRLTQLFERIRYGSGSAQEHEQQEAEACLHAIVKAYKKPS